MRYIGICEICGDRDQWMNNLYFTSVTRRNVCVNCAEQIYANQEEYQRCNVCHNIYHEEEVDFDEDGYAYCRPCGGYEPPLSIELDWLKEGF
jgi:hypothetical protein